MKEEDTADLYGSHTLILVWLCTQSTYVRVRKLRLCSWPPPVTGSSSHSYRRTVQGCITSTARAEKVAVFSVLNEKFKAPKSRKDFQ